MFGRGVDFPWVPVVCVRWMAPSLVRTSFGSSSDATDMHGGSAPRPNVLRMLRCELLSCGVAGACMGDCALGALLGL